MSPLLVSLSLSSRLSLCLSPPTPLPHSRLSILRSFAAGAHHKEVAVLHRLPIRRLRPHRPIPLQARVAAANHARRHVPLCGLRRRLLRVQAAPRSGSGLEVDLWSVQGRGRGGLGAGEILETSVQGTCRRVSFGASETWGRRKLTPRTPAAAAPMNRLRLDPGSARIEGATRAAARGAMQGRSEVPGANATALPDETRRSAAGSHPMPMRPAIISNPKNRIKISKICCGDKCVKSRFRGQPFPISRGTDSVFLAAKIAHDPASIRVHLLFLEIRTKFVGGGGRCSPLVLERRAGSVSADKRAMMTPTRSVMGLVGKRAGAAALMLLICSQGAAAFTAPAGPRLGLRGATKAVCAQRAWTRRTPVMCSADGGDETWAEMNKRLDDVAAARSQALSDAITDDQVRRKQGISADESRGVGITCCEIPCSWDRVQGWDRVRGWDLVGFCVPCPLL